MSRLMKSMGLRLRQEPVDPSPGPLDELILKVASERPSTVTDTPSAQLSEFFRDQTAWGVLRRATSRRILRHFTGGFSAKDLAKTEGVTEAAIHRSLNSGLKKIGFDPDDLQQREKLRQIHLSARARRLAIEAEEQSKQERRALRERE